MELRKSLHHLFEKYEVPWEVFMVFLALAYVVITFIIHLGKLAPGALGALDDVERAITLFFVLEFAIRLAVAPSRRVYIKEHWLDAVALLPVIRWLRLGRLARVIRLLRFVRLARVFGSLDRLKNDAVRFAEVNGLQWMLLILTIIMFVSSIMLFLFEYPVNDKIKTYWDALYAALVT